GTEGLWRVSLCPQLFSGSVEPCLAGTYHATLEDIVSGSGTLLKELEHKRCVDIAILDTPTGGGGHPVLFALFAASSFSSESDIGGTELRAYKLVGTDVVDLVVPGLPFA